MKSIISRATILSITALSLLATTAVAGSLTPPGAPAPTMKTLDEVEARIPIHSADLPLTINKPGSYYLAESITHSGGGDGITINAPTVTIDLNGFTLKGPGSGGPVASGILASASQTTGTVIKNGVVSDWPGSGIQLGGAACLIENVHALQNSAGSGIAIATGNIIDCTAEFNSSQGIICGGDSGAGGQSIISDCKSRGNKTFGIWMRSPGLVANNTCSKNASSGILLNSPGIIAEANTCTANSQNGIYASGAPHSIIRGNNCSLNANTGVDITAGPFCIVKDNNCSGNSGDGIRVSSSHCRVEGNHVSGNSFAGLEINNASIALKNTATGNSVLNYIFTPSVRFGVIVVPGAGAGFPSDQPWANFEY